jgi:hypothetical protein
MKFLVFSLIDNGVALAGSETIGFKMGSAAGGVISFGNSFLTGAGIFSCSGELLHDVIVSNALMAIPK